MQSLNLDGGGWRMPTVDELDSLYKKGTGSRNMTPLLKNTGWWVWSGETKGSSKAGGFHFSNSYGSWDYRNFSSLKRAFAVRSRSADFKRKKKGSQNQKVEVAGLPQKPDSTRPSSSSDVIKRDGTYVAYANGIVKDTNTGLEWKAGPNRDTDWNEARSWVQSLNLDGGGWRMPTVDELDGLYKKGTGSRNMTPFLKTTGWWVWSGETKGSSKAGGFHFSNSYGSWDYRNFSSLKRAFAVRSRSADFKRKKKGSQNQKVEVAGLPQKPDSTRPSSSSDVIKRDGTYVAYANGIVKDTKTGLEWKAGPNRDIDWNEARSWVQSLNLDGGSWRMPTMDEVASLYKKGTGSRNMTPFLKTTGWWVWSGETKGSSSARSFPFDGSAGDWLYHDSSNGNRVFAVRSRKRNNVASIPQKPSSTRPSSSSNEIERDGVYVAYANGIVKNTKTGLEWKVGPDKDTTWNEARSWVHSLNLDGGGWRMPTMDELKTLYKKGAGKRNMTPLLKTKGWDVWSGEIKGSSDAKAFSFYFGSRDWDSRDPSPDDRAFAVRSRSDG